MEPVSQESRVIGHRHVALHCSHATITSKALPHRPQERYARRGIDARLRQVFDALDADGDGRVSPRELSIALRRLGARRDPASIEIMVWEVDEDHDGAAGWAEFRRAYDRCAADADACEPRQLYNVVIFMLHAEGAVAAARGGSSSGEAGPRPGQAVKMTAEDATRLIYLQHGRVSFKGVKVCRKKAV
jgi:hypothetical protein